MQLTRHALPSKTWLVLGGLAVAGTAVAVTRSRSTQQRPSRPAAPERVQEATVGGIRMRWEQHGDDLGSGLPVIFVHGLPTNPRAWRYVIPEVASPGICCLAWEQVGFGHSLKEGMGRDLSISAQASYLRAWLRHLGIERAVFVAHDYGGGVVQHLMAHSPELLLGVVLTDSVAFDNWPVPAVRSAQAMSPVIERLPPALVRPMFRAALANLGHTDPAVAAESADLFWRPYSESYGPAALAHQLRNFHTLDTIIIGRQLKPLPCPTFVLWGERDPLGLDSARLLAERTGAHLRVIPDAYHFTIEDSPEEIAEAIHETIARARTTPPGPIRPERVYG